MYFPVFHITKVIHDQRIKYSHNFTSKEGKAEAIEGTNQQTKFNMKRQDNS